MTILTPSLLQQILKEYALPLFRHERQLKQPAAVVTDAHLGEVTDAVQRIDLQAGKNSIGSGGQRANEIRQRGESQHKQRHAEQPAAFRRGDAN